jgi:hypothetical protein
MRLDKRSRYVDDNDDHCGDWTNEQLEQMNARFTEQLERAFELGLESRESARCEVKLLMGPTVAASVASGAAA